MIHYRIQPSVSYRRAVGAASGFASLAVLLLGLGCSDSPTAPGSGGPVAFSTVVQQSYSGVEVPRQQIIRDPESWAAAWREIHARVSPKPATPVIDFSRRMLVLTAMGERPNGCYQTTVRSIRGGDALEVSIEERAPGAGCGCTEALTHPVHVVELDRRDATPRFAVEQRTVGCG